jgi:hypothetical protein
MSGTSIISKATSPITSTGEKLRLNTSEQVGSSSQLHRATGIVSRVHNTKPRLVVAYDENDQSPLANGDWIVLNHSAQEIAERWGTIRPGFRIQVTFMGPSGAKADATIIGTENQTTEEPPVANEIARGLFALFAPGIGV